MNRNAARMNYNPIRSAKVHTYVNFLALQDSSFFLGQRQTAPIR